MSTEEKVIGIVSEQLGVPQEEISRTSSFVDDLKAEAAGSSPPKPAPLPPAALPAKGATKDLWIREGSGHGAVWKDDPDGYRQRLGALLDRIR